jgi:protocatechuate 3,4-dioxygenase beta subunit
MTAEHLTRRQLIAAGGAAGLPLGLAAAGCGDDGATATSGTTAAAGATPASNASRACVLTPESTEGPYYLPDGMIRQDITEGRPGVPLQLRLTVQDASNCTPIENATVELWQCDAVGAYSGVNGDSGRFLRGGGRTGADGVATFDTIYPGWYPGRTTHIHVKVHVGGDEVHTGQLYFDESVTRAVYRRPPYAGHGAADTTNASDGIFGDGEAMLEVTQRGDGYAGELALGVQA